jgi:capsular polysaccharide biosynthesis protein
VDLWSAIFTVLRRWYVALPILAASVAAAVVVGGRIQPEYKTEMAIVFEAPQRKVVNGQEQPFVNAYAADPQLLAALTGRVLRSEEIRSELEEQDLSPQYELAVDNFSAIIDFVVVGTSEDQALDTSFALIEQSQQVSRRIQNQGDPTERVEVRSAQPPSEAERQAGSKPRVMASLVLLGIVGAAGAAFILESLSNRRRNGGVPATPAAPPAGYPGGYIQVVQVPAGMAVAPNGYPNGHGDGIHTAVEHDDFESDLDALLDDVGPDAPPTAASGYRNGTAGGSPLWNGRGDRRSRLAPAERKPVGAEFVEAEGVEAEPVEAVDDADRASYEARPTRTPREINQGKRRRVRSRYDAVDEPTIDLSADPDPGRPSPPYREPSSDEAERNGAPDPMRAAAGAPAVDHATEGDPAAADPVPANPARTDAPAATEPAATARPARSAKPSRVRRTSLFATETGEQGQAGDGNGSD